MHSHKLSDWLAYIVSIHAKEMDLGLERVKKVAKRLGILEPPCPVIIVGGTNGKGSTVAALESIYSSAGYRIGSFTSPYLFKPNEQVRIEGEAVSDRVLCEAFAQVEAARQDTSLTQFEFFTLAAMIVFNDHDLNAWILEVGLGGRLDAVNILDADVAIVTSISIDHTEWLGKTREAIAQEKAGIFRPNLPAVCGDLDPPATLINYAQRIGAKLYRQGVDFHFTENKDWQWQSNHPACALSHLPINSLLTQNMSTTLMAITLLQQKLPVTEEAIRKGLTDLHLAGRMQIKAGPVMEIYDVAHNQASVRLLAERIQKMPFSGRTLAVFSMLADKEIAIAIEQIRKCIDHWYVAPLDTQRGATAEQLQKIFADLKIPEVNFYPAIHKAYLTAQTDAKPGDRIIIFGSFYTISGVLKENP